MGRSFETIKTKKPWYRRPGTMAALGVFVVLGAVGFFLLKGDEKQLLARVKARDASSAVCAYAIGWRGLREDATRDVMEETLATGATPAPAPEELRRACAYALGRSKQAHAARFLIDAIEKDPSVPVRCAAVRGLARTQEPVGAEPIFKALEDHEADVRLAAAEGCRDLGDKRAIDKLIDHLDESTPAIRRACHESLVALTGTVFEGTDEKREWRKWRENH